MDLDRFPPARPSPHADRLVPVLPRVGTRAGELRRLHLSQRFRRSDHPAGQAGDSVARASVPPVETGG